MALEITQSTVTVDGNQYSVDALPKGIQLTIEALLEMETDRQDVQARLDMLNTMVIGVQQSLADRIRLHLFEPPTSE